MKKHLTILFCFVIMSAAKSQQTFIKSTTDTGFGLEIRVLPMLDKGWIVCSLDSLKFAKFNNCGNIEWSRHCQIPNTVISLTDVIKTKDDGIVLLTRMKNGNMYFSLITKLDPFGNVLWSKSYEDAYYDHVPYTISEDVNGNLYVFANVTHLNTSPYHNMVLKTDLSGNLIWIKFYNHGGTWGGAITTNDNGFLFRTGGTFVKIDSSGSVQWTSNVFGMPNYYYAPIEVSDGYIFTNSSSGNSNIAFYKIDKQGNQIWQDRKTLDIFGNPRLLRKRSNGNIVVLHTSGLGGLYSTVVVELDKDLNVVNGGGISAMSAGIGIVGKDICFLSDNTPVVAGIKNVGYNLFFSKTDQNYNSDCSFISNPITITLTPTSVTPGATTATNYSLNTVNRLYNSISIPISQALICPGPKNVDLGNDTTICDQVTMSLKNKSSFTFENYLWSTGETTQSISVNQSGIFWLKAWDDCEQVVYSDSILIEAKETIEPNLGDDLILCENETVLLKAPLCDSCSYRWNNNDTLAFYVVKEAGEVRLQVENNLGCIGYDTLQVDTALCDCNVYFPNAFTPNSDGLNDVFYPKIYCQISDYNLEIFDRWGKKIYQTSNMNENWNGKLNSQLVPIGVYVYKVSYQSIIKGVYSKPSELSGRVSVMY